VKERRAGAAETFRNLDPHDAEVEELAQQFGPQFGVLVHLPDERAHFPVCELVNAVAEEPFVLGQTGEWST